jgi:hypothetical protein
MNTRLDIASRILAGMPFDVIQDSFSAAAQYALNIADALIAKATEKDKNAAREKEFPETVDRGWTPDKTKGKS